MATSANPGNRLPNSDAGDECDDGLDNDRDGAVDYPADTGCSSADDPSEKDVDVDCDDGFDNDADGRIDFPEDCGCASDTGSDETANDPPGGCPDDDDDDDGGGGDGKCGIGFELILLLPPLMALRRRRAPRK